MMALQLWALGIGLCAAAGASRRAARAQARQAHTRAVAQRLIRDLPLHGAPDADWMGVLEQALQARADDDSRAMLAFLHAGGLDVLRRRARQLARREHRPFPSPHPGRDAGLALRAFLAL